MYDGRKAFIENRDRALSLRSVGSEDSGYWSGNAHSISKNLAAISEDGIDEHTEFGLFNGAKCESTSDLVNSFPFFTLTRLYMKPASSENLPTITDFIVAVSLADFSLWAIFDAWGEDCIEAKEGDEADWIGEEGPEMPLKPLWSSTWATLPGLDGRVRMTELPNSIYAHVFASTEQIDWANTGEWSRGRPPGAVFPVLIP